MKKLIALMLILIFSMTALVACTCGPNDNRSDATQDPNATETALPHGGGSSTDDPNYTAEPDGSDVPTTTSAPALEDISPFVGDWVGNFGDIQVRVIIDADSTGSLSYGDTELDVTFVITATTISIFKDDNTTVDVTYTMIQESINVVYIGTTITFVHYEPPTDNDSIIGSWSGTEEGVPVVYVFNADGSGSLTAMGIPMALTYTISGNTITMTVSAFGDTDTAVGTFVVEGNTLTLTNEDGETNTYTRG